MNKLHSGIISIGSIVSIIACIAYNLPLYYGFFTGLAISLIIFSRNSYTLRSLSNMIFTGILECSSVFIIIILIGVIISVWMASGVVPTMIYYGFNYISFVNFLLACFIITGMVSMVMGTALGTISTIGMAMLAMGKGLEIPLPIVLGAIISGGFLADKISPVGALVNLTLKTIGINYKQFIKSTIFTLLPTIFISSVIYYFIGLNYRMEIDMTKIISYQQSIDNSFNISPLLLGVPIIIMIMAIMGIKVLTNMLVGVGVSMILGLVVQSLSLKDLVETIIMGYIGDTGSIELDSILRGGGILPMLEVVLVIIGAISLNSIFEGTGFYSSAVERISKSIKNSGDLVAKSSLLSMLLTTICDQTVGILIPGKLLITKYNDFQLNKVILARTIADTGTSIAPLIPWNVNAIVIMTITGISVFHYGPYVLLSILSPIITATFGYLGNRHVQSRNATLKGLN